jgi:hypothetical protein
MDILSNIDRSIINENKIDSKFYCLVVNFLNNPENYAGLIEYIFNIGFFFVKRRL